MSGSGDTGDTDLSVSFSGTLQGSQCSVVADSCIKGNVWAVVFYATPTSPDAVTLGAIAEAQAPKLS